MIITVTLKGRRLSMTAPLGAAAFAISETPNQARIIFGMMKQGENGLKAFNRIKADASVLHWTPVAARPASQIASEFTPEPYIEYVLLAKDGAWSPATDAVANFMKLMQAAQSLPATAPSALAASISAFRKATNASSAKKGSG